MADYSLQLQADNLPIDTIEGLMVDGPWSPIMARMSTAENILLEGCRGAGKTMLMRSAAKRLVDSFKSGGKVFGVHATFKRYLAAIPPADAGDEQGQLSNFKAWINARILGALKSAIVDAGGAGQLKSLGDLGDVDWNGVIGILETTYRDPASVSSHLNQLGLKPHVFAGLQGYTYTHNLLSAARAHLSLDLLIVFLDDAAHALDTRAQAAFFSAIKSLYGVGLAFKISVYPAVTRYGVDFSYGHDAIVIPLGDTPRSENLAAFVNLLRRRRDVAEDGARSLLDSLLDNPDWIEVLFYCSNGNPRGLLKLVAQVQTQLATRSGGAARFEDVRAAINTVMDKHLDNMVPGVVKDLDPRLLKAAEVLLFELRQKISVAPGPYESGKPRGYLSLTNSMQVPYICQAAVKLLVAANVMVAEGPSRLSKRESGTVYLLHPGFIFRDNVIAGVQRRTLTATDWTNFFRGMSSRVHAEVGRGAELWQEVAEEAKNEPSGQCVNGHPMYEPFGKCEMCGAAGSQISPVAVLLNKSIDMLDLSDALRVRLKSGGFQTVRDLFEATDEQIDEVGYIGGVRTALIKNTVSAAVDEFVAG
ncbi:hypothetical protein [Stenotrophomonas sp.]|uniref:hypothetical protein n=1 Tax=Stenotrophomonas sp. TaxID=69392 RepID=UPI00333E52BE